MHTSSYPLIDQSNAWYARALGLIPAVTQTLAKGPGQHVNGVAPKYLKRGKGASVWDVDGNEFIDFNMAIGPLSLGYGYDVVDQAVIEQLADGITFSLMHPLEVEVAELVREVCPGVEMVRFAKSGAEVTSAAIRAARAFSGRAKVLCCGYHGWHDWYISVTDRSRGIPDAVRDLTWTFDYNDIASVADALDADTACVILEPMVFEHPKPGFLEAVKDACTRNGTVLIFDEMWTGFRWALGGAQERFGVTADLVCYSKAIANGMPLAVLAGRADIMRVFAEDVFFFSTFGGEALSLAAARATIREIRDRQVTDHLAEVGRQLRDGYNQLAAEFGLGYTKAVGADCRSLVTFDAAQGDPLLMKSLMQQELLRHGILWGGFHNVSFSHGPHEVDALVSAYRAVLPMLGDAVDSGTLLDHLRGEPVQPIFRRTSGFNMKAARNAGR